MTIDDDRGRLSGRRVLLTGASSGVGLAAALAFADEGAQLALLSRNPAVIEPMLEEHGARALTIPVDLTERDAVERAVEEAAGELGGLDIVVSNAAAAVFGHLLEVDPDDFDRTVAVTFTGAVNVIRATPIGPRSSPRRSSRSPSAPAPRSSSAARPCSWTSWTRTRAPCLSGC